MDFNLQNSVHTLYEEIEALDDLTSKYKTTAEEYPEPDVPTVPRADLGVKPAAPAVTPPVAPPAPTYHETPVLRNEEPTVLPSPEDDFVPLPQGARLVSSEPSSRYDSRMRSRLGRRSFRTRK